MTISWWFITSAFQILVTLLLCSLVEFIRLNQHMYRCITLKPRRRWHETCFWLIYIPHYYLIIYSKFGCNQQHPILVSYIVYILAGTQGSSKNKSSSIKPLWQIGIVLSRYGG